MLEHEDITREVIGAAFEVHRSLGYGFLEKVHQKALQVEILSRGLACETEKAIRVFYKGHIVGDYFAEWKFALTRFCIRA
ncbi:MAG: GxxExxY protein [Verrucomicrobiota bacterium JB022]|nr:GxxExxY protein [Verrucomicrobiota bacterium JB022]